MPKLNEWTVMFFFAGDNALSPLIVSQVKSIKDAGFQENTDVLVHFDSNEQGAPTRLYHVNLKRKNDPTLPNTLIGDGDDPFIRNLKDDIIDPKKIDVKAGQASVAISQALQKPDKITAREALSNFLGFCRENHRAKHYILFLVGHGLIVGNDTFLPDEHPVSAITLRQLQTILKDFTDQVKEDGNTFELLAMHSCSMSGIEVAYQLKGTTANYMIASEGISYVGSWPYRQLLKKIFNTIEDAKEDARREAKAAGRDQEEAAKNPNVQVETLVEKLYFLSLFNATDFMLSGYSLDLCLCSLAADKFEPLTAVIKTLVAKLKKGLEKERATELILLAHWKSQSYWGENYTDLYDFCRCLRDRCLSLSLMLSQRVENSEPQQITDQGVENSELQQTRQQLQEISTACSDVIEKLKPNISKLVSERFKGLIIHSDHFGPNYQYSHGLSVYFPWSRPIDDDPIPQLPEGFGTAPRNPDDTRDGGLKNGEGPVQPTQHAPDDTRRSILKNYAHYAFTTELMNGASDDSWLSFLEAYFKETKRKTRKEEDRADSGATNGGNVFIDSDLVPEFFNPFGGLSDRPSPALNDKPSPSTGSECGCPSIKNYPTQELTIKGKQRDVKAVSISEGAYEALK